MNVAEPLPDMPGQEQLEVASTVFNAASEQLSGAYRDLQLQVERLTRELMLANGGLHRQLAAKEALSQKLALLLRALPGGVIALDPDACDMSEMVKRKKFREDLYYRLNVFPIEVPALRQRPLDIEPLARRFVKWIKMVAQHCCARSLSQDAINILTHYHWPDNVLELENVMQRAILPVAGTNSRQTDISVEAASLDMKALERKHILDTLRHKSQPLCRGILKLGF
ncbi:Sigma-54 interaction domain-containing protein [Nitrosomonas sp. Nm51]|uniref:sigma 54-interacting transcriptional regulator n=1 Tax=Nitrosomonas sp. Nm51 TaxID=133720 RepID=UPI0008BAD78C|nr:sigma 54-interacting transcriptional regulator [Nitrosomonas sp. Nm51]SER12804.1 Sigma-54 interaction domain-containing protein [Nitrosomonas sp. Nm51]